MFVIFSKDLHQEYYLMTHPCKKYIEKQTLEIRNQNIH